MIGTTISHYKILEKLGEGGMGIVYKAQDTKLNRFVALKFLPLHVSEAEQDKERFLQEAQAAASLSHSNICTIHGIEEHEGKQFIVMEFVDGHTLQEKKSSLPMKQALEVGIQIAEGLAAAHEKGIVHRDIKPENIMIKKDGTVQIMDFGLAKLRGATRLTKEGLTIGTVGYMSPEQVQGMDVDHRTDIFSLGVLLYEMFTGQSPFKGVHETAIIYEIVNVDPPPMAAAKPEIDADLDAIVLDCMAKDPADRYQSAAELARNLRRFKRESSRKRVSRVSLARPAYRADEEIHGSSERGRPVRFIDRMRNAGPLWIALSILFFITTIVSFIIFGEKGASSNAEVIRFTIGLPDTLSGLSRNAFLHGAPVVSPDGRTIASSADQGDANSLFVRQIDQFESISIAGGGRRPFFSPDSRWLAFLRGTGASGGTGVSIWKVPAKGGVPSRIGDVKETDWNVRGQAWHPDGRILVTGASGLWALPSAGGEASLILVADSVKREAFGNLSVTSDGNILISVYSDVKRGLSLLSTNGLTRRDLPGSIEPPASIVEDILVFTQAGQWRAGRFDVDNATLTGDAVAITGFPSAPPGAFFEEYMVNVSRSVAWIDAGEGRKVEPVWVSRSGGATAVGLPPSFFRWPRLSPDGRRLAVRYDDGRLYAVDLRTRSRLLLGTMNDHTEPVWSPDGRQIVFSGAGGSGGGGTQVSGLLWQVADASRPPDTLLAAGPESWPTSFSPDGRFVAYYGSSTQKWIDLHVLEVKTKEVRDFPMLGAQRGGRFSPNGRWFAYQSDESGRWEVYVRPWPAMKPMYLVSVDGGEEPAWSADGKELYFRYRDRMMVIRVGQGTAFDASLPTELFRGPYPRDVWGDQSYDVGPDGRFLMMRTTGDARLQAHVVLNWVAEVRRLLEEAKR